MWRKKKGGQKGLDEAPIRSLDKVSTWIYIHIKRDERDIQEFLNQIQKFSLSSKDEQNMLVESHTELNNLQSKLQVCGYQSEPAHLLMV